MVQTLEAIKGGGGSIKVGTTGTISALMLRELNSVKCDPRKKVSSRNKSTTAAVLVPNGGPTISSTTTKRLDEASSSGSSKEINHKNPEIPRKTKCHTRKPHQIPMLNSDNISVHGSPSFTKPEKRASYIVEAVDVKCGNPDRTWVSPITSRLKKLGFSKLSETIG